MSETLDKPEVRPYDFRRPLRPGIGHAGALEPLHTLFAANLAAALGEHLRTTVEVSLAFIEQLRYDEFVLSLGTTSCLGILRVDPTGAQVCLDLGLPVIYPMIDRLLGGNADGTGPIPSRPLTQIECGLALQIFERAAGALDKAWNTAATLSVREESLESTPASVRIMPGNELVTAARFEVRLPGGGGLMSLCVPAPVLDYLKQTPADGGDQQQNMTRNILDAAVELRALLAATKLRLSDVLDMQAGDVITTDTPADATVPIQVQGTDKFEGRLGQFRGARAVQISPPGDLP